MASQKSKKRNFNGMSYGEVQRTNTENRSKLEKERQKWLKDNGYKNVGWKNVIALYQKIEEFLDELRFQDMSLEELFLEADRIGNNYLSSEEIDEFNQQLTQEVNEIEKLVDEQFPDTEIEVIDFSQKTAKKPIRKTYRTAKL
jgi:hypothetical protein